MYPLLCRRFLPSKIDPQYRHNNAAENRPGTTKIKICKRAHIGVIPGFLFFVVVGFCYTVVLSPHKTKSQHLFWPRACTLALVTFSPDTGGTLIKGGRSCIFIFARDQSTYIYPSVALYCFILPHFLFSDKSLQ